MNSSGICLVIELYTLNGHHSGGMNVAQVVHSCDSAEQAQLFVQHQCFIKSMIFIIKTIPKYLESTDGTTAPMTAATCSFWIF